MNDDLKPTIQDAIHCMKIDMSANADCTDCRLYTDGEQSFKCCKKIDRLVIEMLEKQLPKKPETWDDGTEHCPNCEHDLTYISSEDEYCCRCGQRLESEKDEY